MNFGGMMRSFYVALSFAIIVALLPGIALSQGISFPQYLEFNNIGGGARAAGMGGAFLGLSSGEYGFSWNPGGMIFAEKPMIGIQMRSLKDKFTPAYTIYDDSARTASTNNIDIKRDRLNLNYSGFVVPFSFFDRQWSVGGGYRNVFDLKFDYAQPNLSGSQNTYTEGNGVDAIGLGVSSKVNENIGVGITSNFYIRGSASTKVLGKYELVPEPNRPAVIDTFDYKATANSHFSGFNLDLGVAGHFGMVKGGLVLHTPYNLTQKVLFSQYVMVPPAPAPSNSTIDRLTYTYKMPFSFAAGVAVTPIEKLTLAADFESHPMSNVEITQDWESVRYQDRTFDPQWQNLNQIRIGAEYVFDAGFAKVPVRVGFRNEPSVLKETNLIRADSITSVTYGNKVSTNILSFGTGLTFQKSWLDIAYQAGSNTGNTARIFYGSSNTYKEKRDFSRLFVSAGMYF
jgi:hypothetical protein